MADNAENRDKEQGKEQKPQAQISFFVRNEAAGKAMARRKVIDRNNEEHEAVVMSWNWRDTWQNEHKRAFVVAKMAKADMLTEVRDSLQKALDEGVPFEQWKKEIVPKLEGKWLGRSVGELWDELSDEEKAKHEPPSEKQREKIIAPERLELIFRTNMAVANAAGHYEQLMKTKAIYPYWRYVTRDDARVRDAHRALHNKVFKWDDPFWETYFPPNGFRCRCHVSPLTKRQVERDPKLHVEQSNIAEDADGRKVLDVGGSYYKNNPGWDYNPGDGVNHLVSLAKSNEKGRPAQVQADLEADLAKKEAEEAAAAKAKTEAEKARLERERQAQEVEKRLQEAQVRAAQRQAQHQAKQAQEAERREKEAEKHRQAAEAAAQKEALQEAQRREADRLRDLEVQKVLQQAREAQGAPTRRYTAKPANTKLDTYVVQDKVRLRKDTSVPAKEERKVVGLAKKIEWEAGKRQFKQSADGKLSPAINGPLYSGKTLSNYGHQALNSIGGNNLQYAPNLNSAQKEGVVEQLKQLFTRPVDQPDPRISKQDLPAWAINICNNKTAILRQAAQGHQEEIKAETKKLIQAGMTGEKLADAVMNYIINFVPLEIADVGTLPDYVIPWLLQEPMVSIPGLTSSSNRNITITNRAILHAMRSTKVNGGRAADVNDLNHLSKIIEQGHYIYDKEHKNIIAFLPCRNLRSTVTDDDKKKVIKLPVYIRDNGDSYIPTIGKVLQSNVKEGKKDRNASQFLKIPTTKKPTP